MNTSALLGLSLLQIISVNSIDLHDDGSITIGDIDPYLHIEVPEKQRESTGVFVSYEMSNYPEKYHSELLFSTNLHGIDGQYRYSFRLDGKKDTTLFIPIDFYADEGLETLRWDFDNCKGCNIKITQFSLVQDGSKKNYEQYIPEDYKPLTFVKGGNALDEKGVHYTIEKFHISGFEHLGGKYLKVKNDNPFIVSPLLDFPLTQLGGVYLKLGVPSTQNSTLYFNLGWRTYRLGYRTKLRLRKQDVSNKETEIFIPFIPLSNEKIVRKFRLRFEPEIGDVWSFEDIMMIPQSLVSQYDHLIPELVDYPGEVASWSNIMRNGFKKMARDLPFFVVYLLGLLGVLSGLVLSFLRNKKA